MNTKFLKMKKLFSKNYWAMKGLALFLLVMMGGSVKSFADLYTTTIGSTIWNSFGAQTLSSVSWTAAATGGGFFGYDAIKGQQFGSSSSPVTELSLTTSGISGTITSVVVYTSGATNIVGGLYVYVGGNAFNPSVVSLTSTNTAYTFTGSSTGAITITWAQSSSKAIYLKQIDVTYSTPQSYTWNVSSGNWATASSWTPSRTSPTTNDILIFDGNMQATPTVTLDFITSESIGQLKLQNNANVTLNTNANRTLNIGASISGSDLEIPSGSTLNIQSTAATVGLKVNVFTGNTGNISGTVTTASSVSTDQKHQLIAADASGITFNSGGSFTAGLQSFSTNNPFGPSSGTLGSVIFANGSTFTQLAGTNPFAATAPNSIVTFNPSSTYVYKMGGTSAPSPGRTFGNFEFDATANGSITSGTETIAGNLIITSGTLSLGGTSSLIVGGNITIAPGATFNFSSSGTITLNGSSIQTISGSGTLTLGNNAKINVTNTAGVTFSKNITIGTGGTFTLPARGSTGSGLVAYYPFNGNANDESGNGYNGTALGGVTNSTDRFGTLNAAYSFDGVNDYIEINNNILTQINGKSALSISYWFNTTSTESGAIWGHGANNNGAVGANTGLASGYYNGVINSWNYTGCCEFYSNPVSPYSTWHQATVVFDATQSNNSKIKIYIDGSLNTSFIGTPNNSTGTGTSMFIGRRNTDFSTFGDYFGGLLDDLAVWNRALTQSEITALYNTPIATTSVSGVYTFSAGNIFTHLNTTASSCNFNDRSITLKSDANGTAGFGTFASTPLNATNITVERYIPALRKFRFLAAPVVGATAANWRNNGTNTVGIGTQITGGTALNNFDQSTTNAASAFWYNEVNAGSDVTVGSGATSDPGWTAFANGNTEALTNGKGFRILVRGDRTISLDGTGSVTPTNTTLSVTGTYPANSVSIATTKTNAFTNSGFNLVGNPYPATIDWNTVTKGADISSTYTTYNPNTGAFVSWNGTTGDASQYIASSQAFFVQQTGATGGITIAEANKATNTAGNYFRNKLADHLKISMKYDSANYDAAFIHFRADAQNNFDTYDGLKFQNAGVNIASVGSDGKRYNINSLASLTKTTEMPLSVLGSVLTNFELKFEDVETFKNHELYLIDNYLNKMLLLSNGYTYPIELSTDSASVKDGRLKIVFVQKATGINLNEKNANAFILYPNPVANAIHLLLDAKNNNNENVSFEIFNQLGARLQQGNLDFTSAKDQEINIENLAQGSYFIKLHGQAQQQTIKFIK